MNQALIDEIVSNVLAKIQPIAARPSTQPSMNGPIASQTTPILGVPHEAAIQPVASSPIATSNPTTPNLPSSSESKSQSIEIIASVITADVLQKSIRPGQVVRIARRSILTPSARDWLRTNRVEWTRQDKAGATAGSAAANAKWRIILQTVTPTLQALVDGLKRLADSWKVELVGQPSEAASLAMSLVSTAECDGVVVFSEYADAVACKSNRNERVRAAVVQSGKQWEQTTSTVGANVVCVSPIGKSFIELRNLLQDCVQTRPQIPAGW